MPIAMPVRDHLGNEFPSKRAMCTFYNIDLATVIDRLNKGWSLEDALTKKKISYKCSDHLGNEYPSISAMTKHYGLHIETFRDRIDSGWSLEEALTIPKGVSRISTAVKDHLGNEYKSFKALAKAYNISSQCLRHRINQGLSLEEALTAPISKRIKRSKKSNKQSKECYDHLGNKFDSIRAMAKYYKKSEDSVSRCIKKGGDLEKTLTGKLLWHDHKGNAFKTLEEMLLYHNISSSCYGERKNKGWSLEKILTTPTKSLYKDHLGNEFKTKREMCDFHKINTCTFDKKQKMGLSLQESLSGGKIGYEWTDHLGNKFKTVKEMCKYHEVDLRTFYKNRKKGKTLEECLTGKKNFSIKGFKTKFLFNINNVNKYGVTCLMCGKKDIMTKNEIKEHRKICNKLKYKDI